MNSYFKECLDKGKIRPFSRGKVLISKEIKSASSDLQSAKRSKEVLKMEIINGALFRLIIQCFIQPGLYFMLKISEKKATFV